MTAILLATFQVTGIASGQSYSPIHSFAPLEGSGPDALMQASDGYFYGVATQGGSNNQGTAFSLDVTGSVAVLAYLPTASCPNCVFPVGRLTEGADGFLYGVASAGNGAVFRISRTTGVVESLHVFNGSDGSQPNGGLALAPDGYFYGTTAQGGVFGKGTAFKVNDVGDFFSLHSFNGADGDQPNGDLVVGLDQKFYGTAYQGGTNDLGVVFSFDLNGNVQPFHSFAIGEGIHPGAGLVLGNDGYLYGTTRFGGSANLGTIYKLDSAGNYTPLHDFTGGPNNDGAEPIAGLLQASDGHFYGTTYAGGTENAGSVFKATSLGNVAILHSFVPGTSDGSSPDSALIQGTDGELYGTTPEGGLGGFGAAFKLVFDRQPPDTFITSAPDSLAGPSASFSFSSTEAGSTFTCSLDGGAWLPCTSPVMYVGLDSEVHSFGVQATDLAGNIDPTPATYNWTVDATPPETTITDAPPPTTLDSAASFSFVSDEIGSTFWCQLDIDSPEICTSPKSYSGLQIGLRTFKVYAVDALGNSDPTPAVYEWVIGAETTITSAPSLVSNSDTAVFEFTSTSSSIDFLCSLDGAEFLNCISGVTYTSLAPGAHTFQVYASGDATPASYTWTIIDDTPPNTFITLAPPPETPDNFAIFEFSASQAGSSFECSLDASLFSACASPQSYNRLGVGAHTLSVRAIDPSGNIDPTPASYSWVIVTDTTISLSPPSVTNSVSASFRFEASVESAFECSLDGSAFTNCVSPMIYNGLAIGPHNFQARATDLFGNVDPTPASYSWTIELAPGQALHEMVRGIDPGAEGFAPYAGLVLGSDGNYYGTTKQGGQYDLGTLYRMDPSGVLTVLHSFDSVTGASPMANLIQASDGYFYGTTSQGGEFGYGTAFRMDGNGNVTPLHSFGSGSDGRTPQAALIQAVDDNFYGTTNQGGELNAGTVFRMDSNGNVTALHSFDGNVGAFPTAPLIAGGDGFLYGTTFGLPNIFSGSVYRMDTNGNAERLHLFEIGEGIHPYAGLVKGTDGKFYGTTSKGGLSDNGTVYRIDTAGNVTVLHSFDAGTTGQEPFAALLGAPDGNFYGTTSQGGQHNLGTAFRMDSDGSLTVLHSFELSTGGTARGGLLLGSDGKLVGTASEYGPFTAGAIYRLSGYQAADTLPPETMITSGPANNTNSTSASFTFTSNETNVTFACSLDGGAFSSCTSPVTYANLIDGSHSFQVKALDQAGNEDSTPASHSWIIDTVAPETTITGAPPLSSNDTSAVFIFSANEITSFLCSLDSSAFSLCTSPASYVGLAEGAHIFQVRAVDLAGNTDPTPATHNWTISLIDTQPPETLITAGPASPTNSTTAEFTFTATETGSSFECSLDGGSYRSCTSPQSYSHLKSGDHLFAVRATDLAGNTDATPASFSWLVDTAAPDTTITSGPASLTDSPIATFHFISNEAGSTYSCSLDDAAFTSCQSPASYSGLADGSHVFKVAATDPAGNTDTKPASFNWSIDTVGPDTTITSGPATVTGSTTARFRFSSSEKNSTFECSLDGSSFTTCSSGQTYSGLGIGNHMFEVRAIDLIGNTDMTPALYSWTIQ